MFPRSHTSLNEFILKSRGKKNQAQLDTVLVSIRLASTSSPGLVLKFKEQCIFMGVA